MPAQVVKGGMGPRMIGKEAHAYAVAVKATAGKGFGKRLLGGSELGQQLEAAEQKLLEAEQAVTTVRAANAEGSPDSAPPAPPPPPSGSYSLTDLAKLLEAEPVRVAELLATERARPDGIRKGAVRIFLSTVKAAETPDDDLVAELVDLAKDLEG